MSSAHFCHGFGFYDKLFEDVEKELEHPDGQGVVRCVGGLLIPQLQTPNHETPARLVSRLFHRQREDEEKHWPHGKCSP